MTATRPPAPAPDAARAARALDRGWVAREGARVFYEVFGEGEETILLMPPWSIIHSRFWKAHVPYLARHFRVLTFDGLGNGRSDRPPEPGPYPERAVVAHTLALLDATGTERALVVAHCGSAGKGLLLAAGHPERVAGLLFMAPALLVTPPRPERVVSLTEPLDTDEGWAKQNVHYWRRDFRGYLEFFFGRCFPEPHSTKQIEDCVGWALETTPPWR